MPPSDSDASVHRFRWVVGLLLVSVLIWVSFFDSHSLLQRYHWHQELEALQKENKQLRADIDQLQTKLDRPLPDSLVERIAREEYGMKKPGETVYRIQAE